MSLNNQYKCHNKIWGEGPSELGVLAVEYMLKKGLESKKQSLLDVGCGYGRDSFYLRKKLGCSVKGVDTSLKAIEMANSSPAMTFDENVKFLCEDFMEQRKNNMTFYSPLISINYYNLMNENNFVGR